MQDKDYIVRATAANGYVRAFAAVTTNMVNDARKVHELSPVAAVALGRTMTAAAIMSQFSKSPTDTLTLQIRSDGPLGGIVVVADANSNVKGYVYNPKVYLPLNEAGNFDVGKAVGKNGYLNVIKDFGLKEPYIGYVKLVSGEIGEDIAYYFVCSEQVPSAVSLGVLVGEDENVLNAGGFIIQLMPDADESIISYLEDKINNLPPITKMLSQGKTPENILEEILGEKGLKILEKAECQYKCNCSRERMRRNLISLGKGEIEDMIKEQHGAEVECHFCNTKYNFSEEELRELVENLT